MFVRSNEKNYLFLCLCLFFGYKKKINKELELIKLLNRRIVKYRNFNFKILIFRQLIPLIQSFLTHSSISNFLEVLWSNLNI